MFQRQQAEYEEQLVLANRAVAKLQEQLSELQMKQQDQERGVAVASAAESPFKSDQVLLLLLYIFIFYVAFSSFS